MTNAASVSGCRVPIDQLILTNPVRMGGENPQHVRVLADLEEDLPPIIVHHSTMRVIDGIHRLRAAMLRGCKEIEVHFFDGNEDDAFILAVHSNIKHGLPLSPDERAAAATRIIHVRPQWSDRRISAVAGMSAKTVAELRRRASGETAQPAVRTGKDGRTRPVDGESGRRRATELLNRYPLASIREVARAAGISVSTVSNVRTRLRNGEDPVSTKQRRSRHGGERSEADAVPRQSSGPAVESIPSPNGDTTHGEYATMVATLKLDPSLRLSDTGRTLLQSLHHSRLVIAGPRRIADAIPAHCVAIVALWARRIGNGWHELAEYLERREQAAIVDARQPAVRNDTRSLSASNTNGGAP